MLNGLTLNTFHLFSFFLQCNPVTTNQVVVGAYAKAVPMVNSEVRNIAKRLIHPEYNIESWNYDVMLLKLDEPVTNIPKVSINSDPAVPLLLSTVTPLGLGRMAEENGEFPMFLQEVDVRVIDSETCNDAPMYKGWIQESMICAGVTGGGQDACEYKKSVLAHLVFFLQPQDYASASQNLTV